jgi:hypothetical protein
LNKPLVNGQTALTGSDWKKLGSAGSTSTILSREARLLATCAFAVVNPMADLETHTQDNWI